MGSTCAKPQKESSSPKLYSFTSLHRRTQKIVIECESDYYLIEIPSKDCFAPLIVPLGKTPYLTPCTNMEESSPTGISRKSPDYAWILMNNFNILKFHNGSQWVKVVKNAELRSEMQRALKQAMKMQIELNIVQYDISEIMSATNNFSSLIGKGGFGEVFTGNLRHTDVAIKKMKNPDRLILQSFYMELNILSMIRHPYIIQLLGICIEDEIEPILVFEYMPNGSLTDQFEMDYKEEWTLKIAYQVTLALCYLHACIPAIIHGDIKAQNILIDKYFDAKVADVGIARILPNKNTLIHSGSPGFLPPESTLSTKVDVYSFGMLLYQMMSKNKDVFQARRFCQRTFTVMSENMKHLYKIANECTKYDPEQRPSMNHILNKLRDTYKLRQNNMKKSTSSSF